MFEFKLDFFSETVLGKSFSQCMMAMACIEFTNPFQASSDDVEPVHPFHTSFGDMDPSSPISYEL